MVYSTYYDYHSGSGSDWDQGDEGWGSRHVSGPRYVFFFSLLTIFIAYSTYYGNNNSWDQETRARARDASQALYTFFFFTNCFYSLFYLLQQQQQQLGSGRREP